jgi:hypothetical protein
MSFERIKEDHFKNIPYTKKQITDIYNRIYSTSKQEQNLVFVETISEVVASGIAVRLDTQKYIGFLHYTLQDSSAQATIGYLPTQLVQYDSNLGNLDALKNIFFTRFTQFVHKGIWVYSVFKFA